MPLGDLLRCSEELVNSLLSTTRKVKLLFEAGRTSTCVRNRRFQKVSGSRDYGVLDLGLGLRRSAQFDRLKQRQTGNGRRKKLSQHEMWEAVEVFFKLQGLAGFALQAPLVLTLVSKGEVFGGCRVLLRRGTQESEATSLLLEAAEAYQAAHVGLHHGSLAV